MANEGHDQGSDLLHEILSRLATNDQIFEHCTRDLARQLRDPVDNVNRKVTSTKALNISMGRLVSAIGALIKSSLISNTGRVDAYQLGGSM